MASLSTFPIEVLEWITSVILTSHQMRLWQCGDRILNLKLQNGGLTSTTLYWSSTPWMPWPRPFFATFTRLRTVEWTVDTRSTLCPSLDLNLLPPTLLRLQIDCDDVYYLLRQGNSNLNALLPSLQSLKLKGIRLSEENLKQLPQQLVELSVSSETGNIKPEPELSKIRSKDIFRDLPSTLEYLKFDFSVADLEEVGNDLPSGLKTLHLSHIEANFDWSLKLPPSLKKLILKSTDCNRSTWSSLPLSLEELLIKVPNPKALSPLLHAGIKSLTFPLMGTIDEDDIPPLPNNLTKFDLPNRFQPSHITHIGFQRLPTSLTDISSICVDVTHPEILSFYHPDTIKMHLKLLPSLELSRLHAFPPKLTSLTIDGINDDICQMLPPQLTYLKIFPFGYITAKGASKLPKSLKTFAAELSVFDVDETMSYIGIIPDIRLSDVYKGAELSMTQNWLSFLNPSSVLKLDPERELPEFDSRHSNSGHRLEVRIRQPGLGDILRESAFQALPTFTHLSALHIHVSVGKFIPPCYIRYVPKSLTDLGFGEMAPFPTIADLLTLPQGLRNLELWFRWDLECPLKDEDLQVLPRSLQHLRIDCERSSTKLTRNMVNYLPPYLMEMTGINAVKGLFIKPLDRLYEPSTADIDKNDTNDANGDNEGNGNNDANGKKPVQSQKKKDACKVM